MTAPVTLAVLVCPVCKDIWSHATATLRWPRGECGSRVPELVGYNCPNGCALDDEADDERRPAVRDPAAT